MALSRFRFRVVPEVFIAMAKFERSLSNNELNYSMMQKIFLAQTLNLGWDAVIDRRFVRIVWLGLRLNLNYCISLKGMKILAGPICCRYLQIYSNSVWCFFFTPHPSATYSPSPIRHSREASFSSRSILMVQRSCALDEMKRWWSISGKDPEGSFEF